MSCSSWEAPLQALVACGVLPSLPPLADLRSAAAAAAVAGPGSRASAPTCGGGGGVLPTQELHDMLAACCDERLVEGGDHWLPLATLLAAALPAERLCRERSTRAALLRSGSGTAGGGSLLGPAAAAAAAVSRGGSATRTSTAVALSASALAASHYAYLLPLGPPDIAGELLRLLGEAEAQRKFFTKRAIELTPAGVVAVLERTESSRNVLRMNDGQARTPGGVFIKEAKAFEQEGRKAAAAAAAVQWPQPPPLPQRGTPGPAQHAHHGPAPQPPLPPLRPYQRDALRAVLSSWGLQLPAELQGSEGGRSRASAVGAAGRPGGGSNWLVCSPTGSGKTRMFVEVARAVVADAGSRLGRGAVVVVLVPRVLLTKQQCDAFAEAGIPDTDCEAHNSECQLSWDVWEDVLAAAAPGGGRRSSVLVCTADSFSNLLRVGSAADDAAGGGPAVRCGQVDLLILDEAHHCHSEHAYAKIAERFRLHGAMAGRGSGLEGRTRILGVTASPAGHEDPAELEVLMRDLLRQLGDARLWAVDEEDPGVAAVLAAPEEREVTVAMRAVDRQLAAALRLQALDQALDVGLALAEATADVPQAAAAGITPYTLFQELQRAAARRDDGQLGKWVGDALEYAQQCRCPALELACHWLDVVRRAAELVEDAGYEGVLPYLARKAAAVCQKERILQQQPQMLNDISVPVSHWVRRLLAGAESGLLAVTGSSARAVVRDCFASGELQECSTFPKLWALVQYLQPRMQGPRRCEPFHGIVFVKTRQAVYHVADMMRRCSQLQFCEVLELVGHTGAGRRGMTSLPDSDRHGRGMSDAEQQQVLQLFKEPGRKVLVATSAAEEGLDVPSCEFVVRYNAAATGIQLLQSRGRARVRASEFVAILQEGTLDARLHSRSVAQEAGTRQYLRQHAVAPPQP